MPRKIIRDVFFKRQRGGKASCGRIGNGKKQKSRFLFKFAILVFILVLLGAFGYVALNRISTAAINISPYRETLAIDSRLRAYANPATTGLSFETMRLSSEESDLLPLPEFLQAGKKRAAK